MHFYFFTKNFKINTYHSSYILFCIYNFNYKTINIEKILKIFVKLYDKHFVNIHVGFIL